jgi:outer membrane protein assembly factor BamA
MMKKAQRESIERDDTAQPRALRATVGALLCAALLLVATVAHAQTIAEVRIEGLSTLREETVRSVIDLSAGDAYSRDAVAASVKRLRQWGVFSVIDVRESSAAEGVVLTYALAEAMIILSTDVAGNYPYVENKVRKYLTLHPGDPYAPAPIAEQVERIKDFYGREGYVGTDVAVEEQPRLDENGVELTFHISTATSCAIARSP